MAKKKKRRYKRNTKARQHSHPVMDKHHICWTERSWSHGALLELRLYWYCIVMIKRDALHAYIHHNMAFIPPPSELHAKMALEQLGYLESANVISEFDSLERRLDILAALFDCCEQPTADAFRKQLELVRAYKHNPP